MAKRVRVHQLEFPWPKAKENGIIKTVYPKKEGFKKDLLRTKTVANSNQLPRKVNKHF